MSVPTIDFGPFLHGTQEEKEAVAKELFDAASTVGFMMLKNFHSAIGGKEKVEEAFDKTKQFFQLPMEVKDRLAWQSPESNRGYVRQGRERVTQAITKEEVEALREQAPDYKETMEIGKDYDSVWPNMWPEEEFPEFKDWANGFFESCHLLHVEIMSALALGMGLGASFFDSMIDQKAHNLRLLNYPPVARKLIEGGGNRAGSHSDYGSVTLLFQDLVGGLEVQDKQGNFIPAVPVAETVVVNIGDLLQRWSNDVLKSTIHRVVLPSGDDKSETTPQRNSIAFFSNPNLHQMISCLPGTGEAKYEPVECEEYLVRRLTATYV
ncbi:thymine dioxygenase [Leucosporidium creatinivorum]|uniref:Thymine dioxygenase n=1 Tax=Leucosporidium creatinivorum TaxID=106004 RepID=A0A1Y2G6H5_9BASI|nr:thymine dioxygenase [Leucosporidium creatinivorum]